MDLRQLRYFLAVADRGSFTRAAASLHVSQPALSLAIGKLEEELGARLFDRGDRFVRATAAGERLVGHARAVLDAAALAREAVRVETATSVVRLGAPALMAGAWLPGAIAAFVADSPDVRIELTVAGARTVEAGVADGSLDLGLISEYQPSSKVETETLLDAELGACVAADHPLARLATMSWDAFLGQPLVLFPRGYYQRELIEAQAARRRAALKVVAETDSIPVLKAIFARGTAAGILLTMSVAPGDGLVVIPFDPPAPIRLSACLRKPRDRNAAAERVLAHLAQSVLPSPSRLRDAHISKAP
jgi:DNA-binding transcriptional LysR family regulator